MNALVTGGTGFIGSHLVEELIRRGFNVSCLTRSKARLLWLEGFPVNLIEGDCRTVDSLKELIGDFDYIFHLAGITKAASAAEFYCTNSKGTSNLIDMAMRYNKKLRRFVHVSTLAAAGPCEAGVPAEASAEARPVSDYGKSKLEGEQCVLKYKDDLPVTIIRPPAVYGPRDKDMHIIFKMIKHGIFPHWGISYYSLIYVEDLVRAMADSVNSDKTVGKTYYLSDFNIYSNCDIASTIAEELNCHYLKVRVPKFLMHPIASISEKLSKHSIINSDKIRELNHTHWVCNSDEAMRDFEFDPKVCLKEGIKWTANWYKIHKWL
ncbi:MAG: NAD(P)-dependent oxidoreductase [Candidatus Magnetominusculus sp. LBB02]|nr:NAD(P)-dependent oxidoreductase [Candidatus Magnetominusculus sp. LBB02]